MTEKPMLDLAVMSNGQTALACAMDRTVSVYDFRTSAASLAVPQVASFQHPSVPSTVCTHQDDAYRAITGCYDGVVRIWDIRSPKAAVSSFAVWPKTKDKPDPQKILSLDWADGFIGVGGEGGFELWKMTSGGGFERTTE